MMRRTLLLLSLFAIASTRYAGRPLADVLREMQQRGTNVVYSSDLVKPDMRVVAEPQSTNDRRILDEILPPLGLAAKDGPGDVVLVVRGAPPRIVVPRPEPPLVSAPAMPKSVAEIVVTASDYAVLGNTPEQRQFLTREEVNREPHLGDDIFRTLGRLPGAAVSDISAAFGVRGGESRDVLVLVDGLEIAEPFHMRYFQNVISVIDAEAIGGLDYISGGAPVEYGDRMSGVVDMSTLSPSERRTYAGIAFTHARMLSSGTFNDDRGQWLFSARRGYFDLLLDLFYSDIRARPRYDDVIAKLQYRLGDRHVLSVNALSASDHFDYQFIDDGDRVHARYRNEYVWLNLRTAWTPRLSSQSVLSVTRGRQDKSGGYEFFNQAADIVDDRSSSVNGLRSDWTFDRSASMTKWGVDVKDFDTAYDYRSVSILRDKLLEFAGNPAQRSVSVALQNRGRSYGVYAAERVRVARPLAIEVGARYDRETWHGEDAAVSPRVNVVFTPAANTAVRASWGQYRQAMRPDELAVEDGDGTWQRAEVARNAEIGVEHHFARGIDARLTVYRNHFSRVRPRYENLFDLDEFFPEAKFDRVRIAPDSASAHGVELLIKSDASRAFSWWVSLAHSSAVDHFGEQEVPRRWDQPEAATFTLNYRHGAHWNFNFGGQIHSGWPTTAVTATTTRNGNLTTVEAHLGERNGDRFPTYQRWDVRTMYARPIGRGTFSAWIDVANVLNRPNLCCSVDFNFSPGANGTVDVTRNGSELGWLPSFGVAWEF